MNYEEPDYGESLRSAARLQQLAPDAVLVDDFATPPHQGKPRTLERRLSAVLDAFASDPEWVLNRAASGRVNLGELGGIEAGVRQMIRVGPLEVQEIALPAGGSIRVPTAAESLRIKAWLIVRRNQVRDFLDVAALSGEFGIGWSATTLRGIDAYYYAGKSGQDRVASQVVRQLSDPRPTDFHAKLPASAPWTDWDHGVLQCQALADAMLSLDGPQRDRSPLELGFRNLSITPGDPVEAWGVEGILTAIDRGSLYYWHKIVDAVRTDPNGTVAQDLSQAVEIAEDHGIVALMRRLLKA
ncbi:transmembrane transport protein MmpL11 [Mycobacteroides abscessus subsp. abscessus]|uniref:Transmembrane transport protein MmpL11 n=1 Tax=Mycobacteroides abscessus TaxID=36809 RepID=A0AB33T8U6_9MYCO|nr:hypothetical protein [Mycobacteroides abscessus]EIC69396.1 hypothetical protein S7W_10704 [Mycobacteroides abscessus M94]MDO3014803.1 hypothetical protein [Mycobacteroides abscessus subsp. abscessus]MDO3086280.1 hypothetical protein [Mycobacteroides abscessus subsp. abscessus]MDO3170183.1 hypothetical protein [Mycobacteroides abscessus subsp. abscessus]OLT79216.1 hypothetical protein BKG58_20230 [Mycobacteroides abscessus subsp. abscessus]